MGKFYHAGKGSGASWGWQSLIIGRDATSQEVRWSVGEGKKILILVKIDDWRINRRTCEPNSHLRVAGTTCSNFDLPVRLLPVRRHSFGPANPTKLPNSQRQTSTLLGVSPQLGGVFSRSPTAAFRRLSSPSVFVEVSNSRGSVNGELRGGLAVIEYTRSNAFSENSGPKRKTCRVTIGQKTRNFDQSGGTLSQKRNKWYPAATLKKRPSDFWGCPRRIQREFLKFWNPLHPLTIPEWAFSHPRQRFVCSPLAVAALSLVAHDTPSQAGASSSWTATNLPRFGITR